MKVLQVVSGYPPMIGGVENSVFELVRQLREQGHDLTVVTANLANRRGERNIRRLRILLKIERDWGDLLFCPGIFRAIKEADFEIVHAHTPRKLFAEAVCAYKLLSKKQFPYIVSIRLLNTSLTGSWMSVAELYKRTVEQYMLRRARFVIVQSAKNREIVNNVFRVPVDLIRIVPNGVDTRLFDPKRYAKNEAWQQNNPDSMKTLLFVGRLTTQKGLYPLFDAVPRIREKCGRVKLLIVGDGPLRHQLQELSKWLGITDDVVFLGEVAHEKMAWVYSQADTFVMPSLSESFPNVMLEAMAMEKACVVTKVGSVPEVATDKDNAILIEPGDCEQIATSVVDLLMNDSMRKRLGANARKLVKEKYTWESVTRQTLAIYEEALA